MLSKDEIRQRYLDFYTERGHAVIPSASIYPVNDSSILFVNSGMSPLVPYLLGEDHPAGKRLVDSQKSFRTEDIDEVGDNRHNTFFEMLGNWSLGDYFKKEQLNWWYEFMLQDLGLDITRLYQTVYAGDDSIGIGKDEESIEIIKEIYKAHGIDAQEGPATTGKGDFGPGIALEFGGNTRIFAYRDKCWWQRSHAIGEPCGPNSETFYDTGKPHNTKYGEHCHLNCDCGRFIEIANSVFMTYVHTEKGIEPLKNKNVDFGAGFERIVMAHQGKGNIFETDLFTGVLNKITELCGKTYHDDMRSFEVVADHLKAATFLMGDERGVEPSNVDQGYVIRRLIRRAIRFGRHLGIAQEQWCSQIVKVVIDEYQHIYPELEKNQERILSLLDAEEQKFQRTVEKGLKQFEKVDVRSGKELFTLFSTYGFPLEMSFEEMIAQGMEFDKDTLKKEFDAEFEHHQELSRTASAGKFKGGLADNSAETTALHTAAHLLLEALNRVLGEGVNQKGSNITAERLRFDFNYPQKLTDEQKADIEKIVNEQIQKDLPVHFEELPIEKAREVGARGVFDDKYEDVVKVYFVGQEGSYYSKEICGGPHVEHTGTMGTFKISKEESSGAGIRRIKAILTK